jgi:hypothetical protein
MVRPFQHIQKVASMVITLERRDLPMSIRDLGTHVVELHDVGTLAISGEGKRLTLSPHEALDLLDWLYRQRKTLHKATQKQEAREEAAWENAVPEDIGAPPDERDAPVDEP